MPEIDLRISEKIAWLLSKPKRVKIAVGGRGCYPSGTEYLTPSGWKCIEDYKNGDKVMVTCPYTAKSYFSSKVEHVNLPADRFIQIKNSRVDFTTSINHKHILRNEKTKNLDVMSTADIYSKNNNLKRGCKHSLIRTFDYGGDGIDFSDVFIRLKIAVIADGHFPKCGYTVNRCRVNLKRRRKIDRLKWLLDENKINYTLVVNVHGFSIFSFKMPDSREKEFENYWYSMNKHQLYVFCDEILRWDGSISGEREGRSSIAETFCSVSKKTIDVVQFACHSCGIKADITTNYSEKYSNGVIYTICVARQKIESSISKDSKSNKTVKMNDFDSIDGRMYCFTTETGFFVVRQHDKIYVSGNSGKSVGISDLMLMFADSGERICCAREFQNSIDDSVHESLSQEISRLGVDGFKVSANEINTSSGGKIFYKGLARNITSLKSLAGVNKLWIEEGESVSTKSLKVLTPSIRSSAEENESGDSPPEIWISMNRSSTKDAIAEKYLKRAEHQLKTGGRYEDDLVMIVDVNYTDNPWFPPELEQERQDDYINLTRADYDNIWNGAYNDSVERAIIKAEWFDACIDAHIKLGIKPVGARVAAHDPSDEGSDNKGFAARHGILITHADDCPTGDINEGMDWAIELCDEIRPDLFIWDCDGMGIGLRRQATEAFEGTHTDISMFKGSNSPEDPTKAYDGKSKKENNTNQDVFRNRRAQYYIRLRDKIYKTYQVVTNKGYYDKDELISFSSTIEKLSLLRAELCRIPTKPNSNGVIQILSKPEMAKMGIDSPNIADSVMMLMVIPESKTVKPRRKVRTRPRRTTSGMGM